MDLPNFPQKSKSPMSLIPPFLCCFSQKLHPYLDPPGRIVGLSAIHNMTAIMRYNKPIFQEERNPRITPTIPNKGGKIPER